MKDLLEISCGLDIHKEKIVTCILTGPLDRPTRSELREFTTLISDMIDCFSKLPSCSYEKHWYLLDADL